MQLLRKTQSQFTRLDQQQIFADKFLILKFLFSELEQFIRVQVRVPKNYFFEFKFGFEFGKITEFFLIRVQVWVRSPGLKAN